MIDVESLERALEIAAQASAAPGPDGVPIQPAIEVREVMGADRALSVTPTGDRRPRTCCATLAPRVLAAVVRRFGDFADAEDAVQEAMLDAARAVAARRACRRTRAAG